ncbi:MAG: DNA alkylation repair protein [Clostridia bacterium]|nr:DNA alkylation repair protein [Clostridia bacterium]
MNEFIKEIRARIFAEKDVAYADFQSALMPSVPREKIIGVRSPVLRKYAAELSGTEAADIFLRSLPHEYYEENNLHAFLIEKIKDTDALFDAVNAFLPYVDNWATCDSMSPKAFAGCPENLLENIMVWISSGKTYTVRYGTVMLMKHFLGENFRAEYLDTVSNITGGEYYIDMAKAWFFAEALAKRYNETVPYLEKRILSEWVHNKAIQKAAESLKISAERKNYLRGLKIKH